MHISEVNSVAVLASGRVVSSSEGMLLVWDGASGELQQILLVGHTFEVNSVAVLDSGRVVSASEDGTLQVWDVASGKTVASLNLGAPVHAVAIVEGAPSLVVAGDAKGRVHILELWEPHI